MGQPNPFGITPNSFEDGSLLSLRYRNAKSGQNESVGVVARGTYYFGIAAEREEMTVISGMIEACGGLHTPQRNPTFVFEKGEKIRFTASVTTSYLCVFGEPTVE